MRQREVESDQLDLQRENERLRAEVNRARRRISALMMLEDISRILGAEPQLEHLLEEIVRAAVQIGEAEAGMLLLLDPDTGELVFSVVEGISGNLLQRRVTKEEGIVGWVVTQGQPLIVNDVSKDERHSEDVEKGLDLDTRSLICLPLAYKGRVIGALEILNKVSGEGFDEDDLDLLAALASQSGTAIENARLYQNLREQRDSVMTIEEDVRKELAHDLHDGPVQLLSATIMQLKFVRQLIEAGAVGELESELDDAEKVASKALQQLRSMVFDLRPVALETEGLIPAVRAYAESLQAETEIAFHLDVTRPEERPSERVEQNVFSIIREAVTNIRKHAQAKNIWIAISPEDGELLVTVRDDGLGFDLAEVQRSYGTRGSLGLLRIRERAEIIGARLTIDSTVGKGTLIRLASPLKQS